LILKFVFQKSIIDFLVFVLVGAASRPGRQLYVIEGLMCPPGACPGKLWLINVWVILLFNEFFT
jgi:hypothetical protein